MALSYIFTAAIMLVSLVIQSHTSFDVIRVANVKPDLLFIAVVYFGYSFGSFYGEVTGFIGGLCHDALSHSPLGLLTLPKVIIGYSIGMIGRSVMRQNPLTVFILMFVVTFIKGLITLLLCLVFNESGMKDILSIVLPESIYNAVLSPFLFMLFDKLFEHEIERSGY
jgi:rod shape-determining protein MreD